VPKRVVISGWYGMGNLGDEVILQSIASQLRARLPNVSVTALSENPRRVREEHSVDSIGSARRRLNTALKILTICRANAFILGGGGMLKDYGKGDEGVSKWLEDMEVAQRLGVPNMTWGVGVGRVWTAESKRWIIDVLPKSDGIFVRDRQSADALSALGIVDGVTVTCDAALMLPGLDDFQKRHATRTGAEVGANVLVCLRHWHVTGSWTFDEEVFGKAKSSLARLLDYLTSDKCASITFVPFRTEGKTDDDREVEEEVRSLATGGSRTHIINYVPSGHEFLQLAADSDLVIGMRLHALILASAIGVPCVGISYEDKVRSYMSSIGADNWVLSIEDLSFEDLKRIADDALGGAYPLAHVLGSIQAMQESAKADINRAVELIERHHSLASRIKRYSTAFVLILSRIFWRRRARKTAS
jgi:polysaccharide pyruvyl transferase CsaB